MAGAPDDKPELAKTHVSGDDGATVPAARGSNPEDRAGGAATVLPHVSREEPGRYSVREEKGRGGMGRVLVAFDEHLGREVAFKELLGEVGREAAQRFVREARVTGQLEHPNIVPVHELGQSQGGALYYTMRLVRGRTLTEALAECRTLGERLRHLGAFWNLCNAVAFAHSRGVVHRDLKPDNVMVGEFGETVLIDWGIARVVQAAAGKAGPQLLGDELEKSQAGAVGTPAYMSPEQAVGNPDRIDARSDVWGLGAVLYELLTGRPPFEAATVQATLDQVRRAALAPVRQLSPGAPPELAAVAEKALEKDPARRYQSAGELAEEIHSYISGDRVRAYAYSSWEILRHFAARHRAAVIAGALALCAIVAALVGVTASWRQEQEARRRSELNLARAYLERAERGLGEMDLDATRRFALASLARNPASTDAAFAARSRRARDAAAEAATTLFQAEARLVAEPDRELPVSGIVGALAYSGDGKILAACDQDRGTVQLWDTRSWTPLRRFETSLLRVWDIALSQDGALLARGNAQDSLEVWDTRAGTKLWEAPRGLGGPLSMHFTPDGMLLASFTRGTPRLLEAATGKVLAAMGPEQEGSCAALTRDGRSVFTADREVLRRWSLPGLELAATLDPKVGPLRLVAASPDGSRLVASRLDRSLVTVDSATGKALQTLRGHIEPVQVLTFTPDGGRIVSQGDDGTRIWGALSGELVMLLKGGNVDRTVAVAPDGTGMAMGGVEGKVKVLRYVKEPITRFFPAHADLVASVAYAPDGLHVATAGSHRDPTVAVWDTRDLSLPPARLRGHTARVSYLAFAPSSRQIASASGDRTLRVWDWARGAEVWQSALEDDPEVVAFSPDGALVAVAGTGAVVRLYEAATGVAQGRLEGHKDTIGGLAFSPDGRRLATASNDHSVRLWDVASRREERLLLGHRDWAWGAAFSPDGRTLATGGKEGEIILWDVATGTVAKTLAGHRKWVNQVVFGPDGNTLVSCSDDWTVRVWDVARGEPRMVLQTLRSVDGVALSPDGAWLFFGTGTSGELFPARLPARKDAPAPAPRAEQEPLEDEAN